MLGWGRLCKLSATAVLVIAAEGQAMTRTDSTQIVRIAELDIDPAQLSVYKAMLTEEMETSVRVEPRVLSLNAVSIKGSPAQIRSKRCAHPTAGE